MIYEYLDALKTRLSGVPVFKCLYMDCPLFYQHLSQVRKHVEMCSQRQRGSCQGRKCPIADCGFVGCVERHVSAEHKASGALDGFLWRDDAAGQRQQEDEDGVRGRHVNISDLQESDVVGEIFSFFFPNGMVSCRGVDDEKFVCSIPGCGKRFKQMGGYKFHIRTHTHSVMDIVKEYEAARHVFVDTSAVISFIERKARTRKSFLLSGVIHYDYSRTDTNTPLRMMLSKPSIEERGGGHNRECLDFAELCKTKPDWSCPEEYRRTWNEGPVDDVMLGCERFKVDGRMEIGRLVVHNAGECITTSSFPGYDGKYMFVGVMEGIPGDSTFEFSSGSSRIHLLDRDLNLRHTLRFEFGFCRKIKTHQRNGVIQCVALFSDGFIRRFEFEEEVRNLSAVETPGIIDFEVDWKQDVILATDGTLLVQISGDVVVSHSKRQRSLITSVCIRENPFIDKSDVPRRGRGNTVTAGATYPLEFYAVSLDGKMTCFGDRLQEQGEQCLPSGYTLIEYLPRVDAIVVVDTLNNSTRIVYDTPKAQRTCTMFSNAVSCCTEGDRGVVAGGFDGTVRHGYVNKKGAKSRVVFQLACKDDTAILCFSEEELQMLEDSRRPFHKYSEKVVGLYFSGSHLLVVYGCGIIVGLALRQPDRYSATEPVQIN